MCGRFAFYSPHEAVARLFGIADVPEIEPRYNIAPTQFVAAVRETGDPREIAMLYWGLVPSWAKEKSIGARMINARSETLGEKPSFRSAYKRRRCLVLADGYYEWQRSGAIKQPYFISFAAGEPFGIACWHPARRPGCRPGLSAVASTTRATRAPVCSNGLALPTTHRRVPPACFAPLPTG